MLTPEVQDKLEDLAALVRSSRYLVAFTGAGISTESGIPDFRGPQGIWTKTRPIELSEFLADPAACREYWRRKIEGYPQMRDAEPNEGHRALASLYKAGRLQTIITQNIDSVWYFMAHPTANFFQYLSLLSHHTETRTLKQALRKCSV
jgi:NAD-dependent deacetylase